MTFAKIFKTGRSQAVRLPKEFRFESDRVVITRVNGAVVLYPAKSGWDNLARAMGTVSPDFMRNRHQPPWPRKERKIFD